MVDGYTNEQLFELTAIDPWFLAQLRELHNTEEWMKTKKLEDFSTEDLFQIKKRGFSDPQIATATGTEPLDLEIKVHCSYIMLNRGC